MRTSFWITTLAWLPFVSVVMPAAGLYLDGAARFIIPFSFLGLMMSLASVLLFVHCWILFAQYGKGTPNPRAMTTKRLVASGIYTRTRNPIYLSYVAYILGFAVFFGSPSMLVMAALLFAALHHYVVAFEEPALRRKFGSGYEKYISAVPRWL